MTRKRPLPPSEREASPRAGGPTVRLARPADAEMISSILYAAFASFAPLYTQAAFDATVLSRRRVVQRMIQGPVWVAESGAGMIGTVAAMSRGTALFVRGMAVIPAAQGQRVGSALLREVERFGIAAGYAVLELRTTPFLEAARRLYERHGFVRMPAEDQLHGTPLIVMQKMLAGNEPGSASHDVIIAPYDRAHRADFERLNRAWLELLWVEPRDERVFADPEQAYIVTGGAMFSALRGGRVVGTVALRRESDELYELCKLAVDESVRGRGIGELLVQKVIEEARTRGARRLMLTTNTILAPAVRLYRRHGFVEAAVRSYPERTRANLEMYLELEAGP